MSEAIPTPPRARPSRRRKASNVVQVDFAKGRPLPAPQKPAGLGSDMIRHSLKKLVANQRLINERLATVAELIEGMGR